MLEMCVIPKLHGRQGKFEANLVPAIYSVRERVIVERNTWCGAMWLLA